MAITEILAVGSGSLTSTPRTVAASSVERVGIKGATSESVGNNDAVVIEVSCDSGNTIFESNYVMSGEGRDVSRHMIGPVTYRVRRRSTAIGAYVES